MDLHSLQGYGEVVNSQRSDTAFRRTYPIFAASYGTQIEVLNNPLYQSPQEELV
jgi:hypothetical protein